MAYDYYSRQLSGERLRLCYELATPRVRRYLEAEVEHVLSRLPRDGLVLELGCGYGRVLRPLAPAARLACGIDTSLDSLRLASAHLRSCDNVRLAAMDAARLAFAPARFDLVCCVQNGISAFHVDPRELVAAAVGVTRPGGRVLFSTYAADFWPHRLAWFREQSAHGLVGEIDEDATGDGVIVCKDGFSATTLSPRQLANLAVGLGPVDLRTVDGSSVFCEIAV